MENYSAMISKAEISKLIKGISPIKKALESSFRKIITGN